MKKIGEHMFMNYIKIPVQNKQTLQLSVTVQTERHATSLTVFSLFFCGFIDF